MRRGRGRGLQIDRYDIVRGEGRDLGFDNDEFESVFFFFDGDGCASS